MDTSHAQRDPSGPIPSNRRGVALAFVAFFLVALLGMTALAVDLGIMYNARAEVQRVADAAALAGAASLIENPGDSARAVEFATAYAVRNDVQRLNIVLEPGDVDVELWRDRVRVRAYRVPDRGTGLGTLFARVLGFNEAGVSAVAAAEAAVAGGASCLLPFALVDRWAVGTSRLAAQDDAYQTGDTYEEGPFHGDNVADWRLGDNTGYGVEADRGRVLRIYPGSTQDSPQPGWYYPIALEGTGANVYRDAIAECQDNRTVVSFDDLIDIEPGRMVGPTSQGFDRLIASDPNAYWDTQANCVKRTDDNSDACVTDSERVRPMVLISPEEQPTSPGRQEVTVRNFVGVFVICQGVLNDSGQSCSGGQGNNPDAGVWVRFVDYRGSNAMSGDEAPEGSFLRVLRLIE